MPKYSPAGYKAKSRREREMHPDRVIARRRINKQIELGYLARPTRCEACGERCKPQAHHDDYRKPLEVKWLCRPCHFKLDGKIVRVLMPGDPGYTKPLSEGNRVRRHKFRVNEIVVWAMPSPGDESLLGQPARVLRVEKDGENFYYCVSSSRGIYQEKRFRRQAGRERGEA